MVRHIKTALGGIALCAVTATAAQAMEPLADGEALCFQRAYTGAHMDAHPDQQVREMQVVLSQQAGQPVAYAWVRAMLEGDYTHVYGNLGICQFEDGHYACGIECDGGRFDIALSDDGTALLTNHGFILHGGCGAEVGHGEGDVEDLGTYRLNPEPDDRQFRLYGMTMEACPLPTLGE